MAWHERAGRACTPRVTLYVGQTQLSTGGADDECGGRSLHRKAHLLYSTRASVIIAHRRDERGSCYATIPGHSRLWQQVAIPRDPKLANETT